MSRLANKVVRESVKEVSVTDLLKELKNEPLDKIEEEDNKENEPIDYNAIRQKIIDEYVNSLQKPSNILSDEKIVLLHERTLTKSEVKELRDHFVCVGFNKKTHRGAKIHDLNFEVFFINVTKRSAKEFYASNLKAIEEDPNYTVVFLSKTGRRIDVPAIKKKYNAQYVKKRLPKKSENSTIYKLLLYCDHIGKAVNSCLPIVLKML